MATDSGAEGYCYGVVDGLQLEAVGLPETWPLMWTVNFEVCYLTEIDRNLYPGEGQELDQMVGSAEQTAAD